MPGLAKKISLISESPIRRIADLLAKARDDSSIISFGGGEPSLAPPLELIDWLDTELRLDPHAASTYSTTSGLLQLRLEISDDLKNERLAIPAEKIILTIGATEGLYLAMRSILNPGDEVILFNPTYVSYAPTAELCDAKVTWLPVFRKTNFQPDLETVKKAITPRTKAIVLLSPDNPTGRVLSKEFVRGISDLATDYNFWLISDESYKEMLYEGKHISPANFTENSIVACSFSKVASIPGFREGYAYSHNLEAVKAMEKIKQYVSLCSVTPAQLMLTKFYQQGIKQRYLKEIVLPTYKARRNIMVRALAENLPEAEFVVPSGAFYIFPDMSPYLARIGMSDEQFSDALYRDRKVVVVPGHYFGPYGMNHVRFTFVSEPEERIELGIQRIAAFLRLSKKGKAAAAPQN